MTIIQQPREKELSIAMTDFVITSESTINFKAKWNSELLLDEDYVPDEDKMIRTHKLGKYLGNILWGDFPDVTPKEQNNLVKTIDFFVDNALVASSTLIAATRTIPTLGLPVFLEKGKLKYTRKVGDEFLTIYAPGKAVVVRAYQGGVLKEASLGTVGTATTFDVSFAHVKALLGFAPVKYAVAVGDQSFTYVVLPYHADNLFHFRFKNIYDAPDTMTCVSLKFKGGEKSEVGTLYSIQRKFDVSTNDEYVAQSGAIYNFDSYTQWYDLLNSREVEFNYNGHWYPIIITRHNFETIVSRGSLAEVVFNFRFADKDDNGCVFQ